MWSAETCHRFFCWDDLSSQQHRVQRCDAQTRRSHHCGESIVCEPLCAALPERQVAQATKAETSLRTPKSDRRFWSHPKIKAPTRRLLRVKEAFSPQLPPAHPQRARC